MRLDQFLVTNSFARSRTQAIDLIKAGKVEVEFKTGFKVISKPSFKCEEDTQVKVLAEAEFQWVSRSGEKLNLALKKLNLDLTGFKVLDVGQSTGGFSECALKYGAVEVLGVDVGKDQLALKLKDDERLQFIESIDARELVSKSSELGISDKLGTFSLLVMDVSFISVAKVIKPLLPFIKANGCGLVLIKPQFEVGKERVKKGGLVTESKVLLDCQRGIFNCINEIKELTILDYFPSGLRGKDGNQEFFCFFKKD